MRSQIRQHDRATYVILFIAFILFPMYAQLAFFRELGIDDAFISFRYARNLAEGLGLVWNTGEKPVEGYTNFLWVIFNAGAIRCGVHPLLFSKILGCASYLAIVGLVLSPLNRTASLPVKFFTAILVAVSPIFSIYAQSGMETDLFVFLTLAGTLLYLRSLDSAPRIGFLRACGIVFAVAAMTRPEGLGLLGITWLSEIFFKGSGKTYQERIQNSRPLLFCFLALWLPFFLWRLSYYGYPFPNTFYAKHTGGGWEQAVAGIFYLAAGMTTYFAVPIAFCVATLILDLKNSSFPREEVTYLAFFLLSYSGFVIAVGGDDVSTFPSFRLLAPIIPLLYLLMGMGLERTLAKSRKYFAVQVSLLSVLLSLTFLPELSRLVHNCNSDLRHSSSLSDILAKLRTPFPSKAALSEEDLTIWIRETTSENSAIAIPWAGKVAYYGNRRAIDTLGLNDSYLSHLEKRQGGIDTKMDASYILGLKPELIFINVNKKAATGEMSFEQAGGWKIGDREMLEKLRSSPDYFLVTKAPTEVAVFRRKKVE